MPLNFGFGFVAPGAVFGVSAYAVTQIVEHTSDRLLGIAALLTLILLAICAVVFAYVTRKTRKTAD